MSDFDPPILRLRKHEERRLRAGHLWVFSNAELDTAVTPLTAFAAGDLVRLVTHRDQDLGVAYLNPATLIAARILARSVVPIDRRWFAARLRVALEYRERLYATPHYRLVFGESDGLPGLVLDRYGDVLVGQLATAGMGAPQRRDRGREIAEVIAPRSLVWKNDGGARAFEQLPAEFTVAWGDAPRNSRSSKPCRTAARCASPPHSRPDKDRLVLIKRSIAVCCHGFSRTVRACSTFAVTPVVGRSPRPRPVRPKSAASTPPRLRSSVGLQWCELRSRADFVARRCIRSARGTRCGR
jgi:hypothetical protein